MLTVGSEGISLSCLLIFIRPTVTNQRHALGWISSVNTSALHLSCSCSRFSGNAFHCSLASPHQRRLMHSLAPFCIFTNALPCQSKKMLAFVSLLTWRLLRLLLISSTFWVNSNSNTNGLKIMSTRLITNMDPLRATPWRVHFISAAEWLTHKNVPSVNFFKTVFA